MDYVGIALLGVAVGVLLKKSFENRKIFELEQEKSELLKWKRNQSDAEKRATTFARKIKKVEDIIIEDQEKNEFDSITLSKIKKELLITR